MDLVIDRINVALKNAMYMKGTTACSEAQYRSPINRWPTSREPRLSFYFSSWKP